VAPQRQPTGRFPRLVPPELLARLNDILAEVAEGLRLQ
jgi:hypothetical protein